MLFPKFAEERGGLRGFSARHGKTRVVLSADGHHFPARLVVVSKVVFFRFLGNDVSDVIGEFFIGTSLADGGEEVELEVTSEAWAEFAVASQPEFVAALAKMEIAHGSDETDDLARPGNFKITRWSVGAEVVAKL